MKDPSLQERFPQLFAGLTVLSLSLVISSLIGATAIREFQQAKDILVVTGSAKKPIRSDYIIVRLVISSQKPTAQAAYQDLTNQVQQVQAYLKDQRVPDDQITLSSVDNFPIREMTMNGQETGQILAHRFTQRIQIGSNEVDKYTQLAQQASELINEGIDLVVEPPQYLYTQLSQLRIEMIGEATQDAKARAEAIARSTGNKVGTVRSAETGVFQITSRHSTDVSDYGIYDTSSLEKDITAVVSVKFSLE